MAISPAFSEVISFTTEVLTLEENFLLKPKTEGDKSAADILPGNGGRRSKNTRREVKNDIPLFLFR